jgi:ABC-2 type transport system permease protein
MLSEELRGIYYVLLKDLRAYYFKPPNISWGILFPLVLTLAFTLRSPTGLVELAPGLIAMSAVFGTTSMEAIVITFEKRVGALERLILAPISIRSILLAKILGGTVFGCMISGIMTLIAVAGLGMPIHHPIQFVVTMLFSLLALSSLGALVAVSVKEVFEAQTLSNYFRFPMIFLCGVFIPIESMPLPIRLISYVLPLTYSVDALRVTTIGAQSGWNMAINFGALALFSMLFMAASLAMLIRNLE